MGLRCAHSTGWSVLALGLGLTSYMIVSSQAVPKDRLSKRFETSWGTNSTFSGSESCNTGDKVYRSGEVVTENAGPCEECICNPPNIQCAMIQCPVKTGCKMVQRPNQCCPQFQCDCEFNGKNYFNGEQIEAQLDKACEVCYCKGGDVMCTSVTCYERNDCPAKIVPGQCCPKYENCPPTGVKESGQTEKTEGSIDDDSKTKKREMQPWLLTNPAEETEKLETMETNAPTAANEEVTTAQTISRKTTIADDSGSNHVDNPSTEYRLYSDNSRYDVKITDLLSSELSFQGTTRRILDNIESTEAYEISTQMLETNLQGDNSKTENYDFSTIKDDISLGTIATTAQGTNYETITLNILRDKTTKESATIIFSEHLADSTKPLIESVENKRESFPTDLASEKSVITSDVNYSDSGHTITDFHTAPLEISSVTENMKMETLKENPEITTASLADLKASNHDFQLLNAAIYSDNGVTVFREKENKTRDKVLATTEAEETTTVQDNIEESLKNSLIKDYVLKTKSQTGEQEEEQTFKAETFTEILSTTTANRNKVYLAVGQIEEKATVINQFGFQTQIPQSERKEEQTEVYETSDTYSERLSTQIYARDEVTTAKVNASLEGETTTYKGVADDELKTNMAQGTLEVDTSKLPDTTESAAEVGWTKDGLTKTFLDHTQRATGLKQDEDFNEDKTKNTVTSLPYSISPYLQNEEIQSSLASSDKITADLIKTELTTEELDSQFKTTHQTVEIDKGNKLKIDTVSDSTGTTQLFTIADETTDERYLVTAYTTTEESTEGKQKVDESDGNQTNTRLDTTTQSSHLEETTSQYETVRIDSSLKLVTSSVKPTDSLGNKLNNQNDQQETNSLKVGTENNEALTTTDIIFTTVHSENTMNNGEIAQGFNKDTFMSAQLSPEGNEYEQKLNTKYDTKITTESIDENSNFLETNSGPVKFLQSTENYTSLLNHIDENKSNDTSDSSIDTERVPSSTLFVEEYTLTESPELVQSILNLAISMQTPDDVSMGIQPPKYIPVKYVGQTNDSKLQENLLEGAELNRSTTPTYENSTFSTYNTESNEATTETLGDTKLVEKLIIKHMQNLTQIALAPVASELLNLVNKSNKTELHKDSSPPNITDEIFFPKESEIERIAQEIGNVTIQSFQGSFETLEQKLGNSVTNSTKTSGLSQPTKSKLVFESPNQHKVRRRRNKVRTKEVIKLTSRKNEAT